MRIAVSAISFRYSKPLKMLMIGFMNPIPFVRDFDFAYGRCDQVSPLIQRVVCANPGPFTYTGTGTYIVGKSDDAASVAVIDPGPVDEAHLKALLKAIGRRKVSHILVTHTHADHSPLSHRLSKACGDAPIYAAPLPASASSIMGMDAEDDDSFVPDVLLKDGDVISGEGWTVETLSTPGHASNHLAFALAEENALFSGDHIMGWSTTIVSPPDGDMADYIASLDKIMAREFAIIWPTHGPAITEIKPFLSDYRAHRMAREEQVLARLQAGDTAISDMVPVLYAAVDKGLWPAASLSLLSHLTKLVKDGRVSARPEPSLAAQWTLI